MNNDKCKDILVKCEQIQKAAKVGYWSFDIKNKKFTFSDIVYEIFEIDKNFDATYESLLKFIPPEEKEKVEKLFFNPEKLPYEVEHKIILKSGRIKYVLEKVFTKVDKDGNAYFSSGTIQDITEYKLQELELEYQKKEFEALSEELKKQNFELLEKEYKLKELAKEFESIFYNAPEV